MVCMLTRQFVCSSDFKTGLEIRQGASQVAIVVKNPPANTGDIKDAGSVPGSGRSPGGRNGQSTPVILPEESHGQRILAGYSPWGRKELDMT